MKKTIALCSFILFITSLFKALYAEDTLNNQVQNPPSDRSLSIPAEFKPHNEEFVVMILPNESATEASTQKQNTSKSLEKNKSEKLSESHQAALISAKKEFVQKHGENSTKAETDYFVHLINNSVPVAVQLNNSEKVKNLTIIGYRKKLAVKDEAPIEFLVVDPSTDSARPSKLSILKLRDFDETWATPYGQEKRSMKSWYYAPWDEQVGSTENSKDRMKKPYGKVVLAWQPPTEAYKANAQEKYFTHYEYGSLPGEKPDFFEVPNQTNSNPLAAKTIDKLIKNILADASDKIEGEKKIIEPKKEEETQTIKDTGAASVPASVIEQSSAKPKVDNGLFNKLIR